MPLSLSHSQAHTTNVYSKLIYLMHSFIRRAREEQLLVLMPIIPIKTKTLTINT